MISISIPSRKCSLFHYVCSGGDTAWKVIVTPLYLVETPLESKSRSKWTTKKSVLSTFTNWKKIYRQIGLLFWSCLVFGSLNTMCNFEKKRRNKKTVSNNGVLRGAIFHFIMFKYFFREIAFMGFCTHQFCIFSTYTIQSYTTNLDS